MNKIKKIIIDKIDVKTINYAKYIISCRYYNKFKQYKRKKKIIYMLVPTHGNMGDQAIAYASIKYIEDNFKEYDLISIYREETYKYLKSLKKILNKDDIIFLHGGGNLGNLYPVEERDRRFIIEKIKNNKIISMTQTMSFSNDNFGVDEMNKSRTIYNYNNNLALIAREEHSYKLMKETFTNKILLNPDIVFYLNNKINTNKFERKNVMTCLRNDKESVLGNKKQKLISNLKNNYGQVIEFDTVINKTILKEERERELNNMFNKFLKSKLVITDRLHGMVFCAITKTPCIATKSLDHKVTGTYEWIKDLNYIRLVDNLEFENIHDNIEELINLKEVNDIDFDQLYFNNLTRSLKDILNE